MEISPCTGILHPRSKAHYTRRSLGDAVSDRGSTPLTSTISSFKCENLPLAGSAFCPTDKGFCKCQWDTENSHAAVQRRPVLHNLSFDGTRELLLQPCFSSMFARVMHTITKAKASWCHTLSFYKREAVCIFAHSPRLVLNANFPLPNRTC